LDEVPPHAHLPLRTDRSLDEQLAELEGWLDGRLVSGGGGSLRP
jgi:hypothetical protein